MKMSYPTILGSPIAGVVEALGPGVTKVSVGDRVACGTKIFSQKQAKYGGHQRFCVVDEAEVVEIGDVPFIQAIPLVSYTPPSALFSPHRLALTRPTIPPSPDSKNGKKILIYGGSSAMGSLSISYARLAGYTTITTCSARNFPLVQSLGADFIFDHSDPDTPRRIRELGKIDYWFDCIALPASASAILKILAPDGEEGAVTPAHILALLPYERPGMPKLPKGITAQMHLFSTGAEENREWRDWALSKGGFLERGIKEGWIQGVPPKVIGGLEKVGEGLDMVFEGVSGCKVVVEPWA
ncbi:NAD(P)-binding protein [Westerdykella ornata]|uniref:NAD(P)-binding protein n=1 Tax=Westerdykella ornata TaxID=318751 RepID=A0A6A6JLR0_WESOR|nr:NAD(P)-binding protein [Westerdykella ornata]KAF2277600.1 NAD(P)-binding protein [Westerdykella ornata]